MNSKDVSNFVIIPYSILYKVYVYIRMLLLFKLWKDILIAHFITKIIKKGREGFIMHDL